MKIPSINFAKHAKQIERLITDNSPTILTAVGVVGVAGTAVLTHKAAQNAHVIIENKAADRAVAMAELHDAEAKPADVVQEMVEFTKAERFSLTWKLYIAPVGAGVLTAACIIGANRISARRAAALAGVLAMTQDNLKEYKDKVQEKLTGPKNEGLKGELAQQQADRVFNKEAPVYIPDGDSLTIEAYSMRQFPCSRELILRAENELNRRILREDSVCLSDFYDLIGLEHTAISDEVGWNTDAPVDVELTAVVTKEGKPAMVINYNNQPIYRPWSAGSFR